MNLGRPVSDASIILRSHADSRNGQRTTSSSSTAESSTERHWPTRPLRHLPIPKPGEAGARRRRVESGRAGCPVHVSAPCTEARPITTWTHAEQIAERVAFPLRALGRWSHLRGKPPPPPRRFTARLCPGHRARHTSLLCCGHSHPNSPEGMRTSLRAPRLCLTSRPSSQVLLTTPKRQSTPRPLRSHRRASDTSPLWDTSFSNRASDCTTFLLLRKISRRK